MAWLFKLLNIKLNIILNQKRLNELKASFELKILVWISSKVSKVKRISKLKVKLKI